MVHHIYIAPVEKIFEVLDDGRTTTDGRMMDHGYTISSPMSLKAHVSLKGL